LPSLTGLAKTKAEGRCASLTAAGIPFNARGMTLGEVLTRFTFPNKTFHIDGDAITGMAENSDSFDKYVWLENPETMQSFEFGFVIKANSHHTAAVEIDGQRYLYARGHWANNASILKVVGKWEKALPAFVEKPNAWASMKIVVEKNKVTFFYDGQIVAACDVLTPMTSASKVKGGFTSSGMLFSVKDVYLVQK
jgi:hypothetical protein